MKCKHKNVQVIGTLSGAIRDIENFQHLMRRKWCHDCGALWDRTWTTRGRYSVRPRWTAPRDSHS